MRFSVVIPTYERRETVVRMVKALDRQSYRDFEVVVVVDGSSDGTSQALRALPLSFPLTVVEQPNQGSGAARNTGADAARGDVLVFLDDDMEAHPRLLEEHEASRRHGADVVFGHLALHPDSPPNLLSDGIERWAQTRLARLDAPGAKFAMDDYVTGQVSVAASIFRDLGGFDVTLRSNEDLDLGFRLVDRGYRTAFNSQAVSYQLYDVDPADLLGRGKEQGRLRQELIFKHPKWASELARDLRHKSVRSRLVGGALACAPAQVLWPLRALAVRLTRAGRRDYLTRRLFAALFIAEYRRGARQARRFWRASRMHVLAYHALADLSGDRMLAPYGVPVSEFSQQVDYLLAKGYTFITLETLLQGLEDVGRFPHRAILLTFDDAYAELGDAIPAILGPLGIRGVVFAVSGHVGGTNDWNGERALTLPLLSADELRALHQGGIYVGSHSVTHRPLASLSPSEISAELVNSAEQLASVGLPRPTAFAYPYGSWNETVAGAAGQAGYRLAFTVDAGPVRVDSSPYALPRIEVLAGDSPRVVRVALVTAAWPAWARTLVMRGLRALARDRG